MLSALDPARKAGGGGRGGGGGGEGGGCCPFKARYEKRRGCGGVLSSASGQIQKAGKGEGLFSRRGGVTIYERGGCNPQNPPPPGSASACLRCGKLMIGIDN